VCRREVAYHHGEEDDGPPRADHPEDTQQRDEYRVEEDPGKYQGLVEGTGTHASKIVVAP